MYPANFFGLFPPFPREKKVFVAMSFDETFQRRWHEVIRPAVSEIELDGVSLEPVRVDVRRISDSIVTEILQGIAHHLVVFADVTTIAYVGDKPIRNANVLYEVGLAHAIRLPEEVILFRSDEDQLIFDITNVRVNSYDPDTDPSTARDLVIDSITNALNEVDLKRHLSVRRAAESLDYPSWMVLAEAQHGCVTHPVMRTMGQAISNASRARAIERLLDLGALKTEYLQVTHELLKSSGYKTTENFLGHHTTPFGNAIFEEGTARILSPEIVSMIFSMQERFQNETKKLLIRYSGHP